MSHEKVLTPIVDQAPERDPVYMVVPRFLSSFSRTISSLLLSTGGVVGAGKAVPETSYLWIKSNDDTSIQIVYDRQRSLKD